MKVNVSTRASSTLLVSEVANHQPVHDSALRQCRCCFEGATDGEVVVTDHKANTLLNTKPAVQLCSQNVRWQQFLFCLNPLEVSQRLL